MAAQLCDCNADPKNTGNPTCQSLFNTTRKLIAVKKYKDDGTRNYITTSTTFNQAWLDALINNADPSARWYPMPEMKNVTTERGDSKKEDFEDGTAVFVQPGSRNASALLVKGTPNYLAKLEAYRCFEFGVYQVDASGNIVGLIENNDLTKLYPIDIDPASWDPKFIFPDDSKIQKIQLNFNWHIDVQDSNLRMISGNNITANVLGTNGLIDVHAEISNITTTGFRAKLTTDFGPANAPIVVKGLVAADFVSSDSAATSKVFNDTDSSDISVTVVESADGVYDFTFVAQTTADVLVLAAKKNGYDFTDIKTESIVIP